MFKVSKLGFKDRQFQKCALGEQPTHIHLIKMCVEGQYISLQPILRCDLQ